MSARYGTRGSAARTPTRSVVSMKRLQPDSPLHMTTRAAGGTSQQIRTESPPPESVVSQTVGGHDLDDGRPAKRVKKTPNHTPVPEDNFSSPLSSIAPAIVPRQEENGYQSDLESQGAESAYGDIANGIEFPDMTVEEGDAEDGPELGSRAMTESRRSTPAGGDSQRTSPAKNSQSPSKSKSLLLKVNDATNGLLTNRGSPDPDEPGGILKRLPGRRRAPHTDINIEVDLRRQLELKVAYRAIAKALKPVLAELADRTARELSDDGELLMQYREHADIIEELDTRLRQRLEIIQASLKEEEDRMQREQAAKKLLIRDHYENSIRDAREDWILRCQNQVLTKIQVAREQDDSDATEYEDDVVPSLYRVDMATNMRQRIPEAYDSRSRWFVETADHWDKHESRWILRDAQEKCDVNSLIDRPASFAVYDGAKRRAAIASLNLIQLSEAAEEVEERDHRNKEIEQQLAKDLAYGSVPGIHALAEASRLDSLGQRPPLPAQSIQTTPKQKSILATINASTSAGVSSPPYAQPHTGDHQSGQKKSTPRKRKHSQLHGMYMPYPPPDHRGLPPGYDAHALHAYYAQHPWPPPSYPQNGPMTAPQQPHRSSGEADDHALPQHREDTAERKSSYHHDYLPPTIDPGRPKTLEYISPLSEHHSGPIDGSSVAPNYNNHPDSEPTSQNKQWTPLSYSMRPPLYMPRYVKDNGLVRPPSPTRSPSPSNVASVPSKPTEWPGFHTATPATHGRASSFDARTAQRSAFPMLAPSALLGRSKPDASKEPQVHDVRNKDRRSVSSPEAMSQDSQLKTGHPSSNPISPLYPPPMSAPAPSNRRNSFTKFQRPYQPPMSSSASHDDTGSSPIAPVTASTWNHDPRRHFKAPVASTPPLRSPALTSLASPRLQDHARFDTEKSRPSSPLLPPYSWASRPPFHLSQNRLESRTSSPLSVSPRQLDPAPQQPPTNSQQQTSTPSSRFQTLQPRPTEAQAALNHPGQNGRQLLLPAPSEHSSRPPTTSPYAHHAPSARHVLIGRRDSNTQDQLSRPPTHPRDPNHPSRQPHTGVFKLSLETDPAHQHQVQAPTPTQPYHYPPHPPQQAPGRFAAPKPSSTSRRNKEPRPPGQLRWQHYVDIPRPSASADASAAGASKSATSAGSGGAFIDIAPAPGGAPTSSFGRPAGPRPLQPRKQSSEVLSSGRATSEVDEGRRTAEREREEERRKKNLEGWVAK